MQGQPDAAYENGDLILGSSNVLRGGLNVLDIAVSDAEDGDDLEVEIANLQGDLRGSAHVKSSEDLEVSARSIIWYSFHVQYNSIPLLMSP